MSEKLNVQMINLQQIFRTLKGNENMMSKNDDT